MNKESQADYSLDYQPTLPDARLDELSYLITQEVMHRLKNKTMREFAEGHDFDAPQVSRWLRGVHNLSLKSIAKLEAALGEPLVSVCGRGSKVFAEAGLPMASASAVAQRVPTAANGAESRLASAEERPRLSVMRVHELTRLAGRVKPARMLTLNASKAEVPTVRRTEILNAYNRVFTVLPINAAFRDHKKLLA